MEARIRGLPELNAAIRNMVARADNAEPAMKAIGIMQVRSVQKNFQVGGRPERWRKSLRAQFSGKGGGKPGKTLVNKGILKNSIIFQTTRKNVKIGPSGPAAVYAAAQQLGADIPERKPRKGKALRFFNFRTGTVMIRKRAKGFRLRSRPFLLFQEQDIRWAKRAVADHMMRH